MLLTFDIIELTITICSQSFERGVNGVACKLQIQIDKSVSGQRVSQLQMPPNFGFKGLLEEGWGDVIGNKDLFLRL